MKKILSTTLAAVALSIAMVSTVDAKITKPRRSRANSATAMSKKEVAQNLVENGKAMADATAEPAEKKAAASDALANLQANPDEFKFAQLLIDRKMKMAQIETEKAALATRNTQLGWFDFSDAEYNTIKGKLATLTGELKTIDKDIKAQQAILGKESSNAVKYAILGLTTTVGLLILADRYFELGYANAAMERVGLYDDKGVYQGPTRESLRKRYDDSKTFVGDTYSSIAPEFLGGKKRVVAPAGE